jgi:hypothetical protein
LWIGVIGPANDTASIGTQSYKALLKRLPVACLACVDIPITLLPIGFVLLVPSESCLEATP